MKRPEILSPAGDLERLKFAVLYGADAVYVGATEFGMRSAPKNFTMEQLAEGVRFAHARGRRVYLTLNTVPTNEEIARMPDFMRRARAAASLILLPFLQDHGRIPWLSRSAVIASCSAFVLAKW